MTAPRSPRSFRLPRTLRAFLVAAALVLVLSGCQYSQWQTEVRQDINQSRSHHNRRVLPMQAQMARKAQNWAVHLARCNCGLQHSNLAQGMPPGWRAIAENVGRTAPRGNLQSMHTAFMNSPQHRANVLDGRWTHVGTGVAADGNKKWVVHVFAQY
jgi:uncharacterized protein YkwD